MGGASGAPLHTHAEEGGWGGEPRVGNIRGSQQDVLSVHHPESLEEEEQDVKSVGHV